MRRPLAALALLTLAACSGPSPYRNADLGGTVSWQEKIVYGPDATLIVYLVDASGPETSLQVDLQKLDNPVPGAELYAATTLEGMIASPTRFLAGGAAGACRRKPRLSAQGRDRRPGQARDGNGRAATGPDQGPTLQVELELAPLPLG